MDNFKEFFGKRKLQLEAKFIKNTTQQDAIEAWKKQGFTKEGEAESKAIGNASMGYYFPEPDDKPISGQPDEPTTSTGTLGLRTANTSQLAKNMELARIRREKETSPEGLNQAARDRESSQIVEKGLGTITDPVQIEKMEKEGLVYFANNISDALINATKLGFPYYGYIKNRERIVRPVPATVKR